MRAMLLKELSLSGINSRPLELMNWPMPVPGPHDLLIRVHVCGVFHTELDEIEGGTPPRFLPIIPGHQVVGSVDKRGSEVTNFAPGDRVGISWIFSACGICAFCQRGEENLCPSFQGTGRDNHGGYADYVVAPAAFAFSLPDTLRDSEAAPLLCAGAVGYRALRLTGLKNGQSLGFTGFGASAHIVLQLVRYLFPESPVSVFARNKHEQAFARELGASWTGDIHEQPPEHLSAIIDTTPVWTPPLEALKHLAPGGRLVINAIRKEAYDQNALLNLSYAEQLWLEKEIKTVANVTRRDVEEFLHYAALASLQPYIEEYPLEEANQALKDMKNKHIRGAKVLRIR